MLPYLSYKIKIVSIVILLVGLVLGVAAPGSLAAPPQASPATWTILVGGEGGIEQQKLGPMGAWQFMRFYPQSLTINVGDTVVWKENSAEPHTVTFAKPGEKAPELIVTEGTGSSQKAFFNPLAIMPQGQATYDGTALTGSGQMGGEPQFPKEYKLTFTKPGTYEYICAFHQMMKGTIIVQAAGTAYPKTQAQIDADAAAQLKADQAAAAKAEPAAQPAATRPGPNGTTIHEVKIGYGDGTLAWMRFSPNQLTVNAGDTVEWIQEDVETPHTVTFTSGGEEPAMVTPQAQAGGPPRLLITPQVLAPAGGTTYSGKGYFNSGFIWGTKAPLPGPRTYSLTFDTPGTYKYTCILHDPMGMTGQIIVQPKGAAASAQATTAPAQAAKGAATSAQATTAAPAQATTGTAVQAGKTAAPAQASNAAAGQPNKAPAILPTTGGVSYQNYLALAILAGGLVILLAGAVLFWKRSKSSL